MGISPLSVATFHLFRLDEQCEPSQYKWRQLKQALVALPLSLAAGYFFDDGVPIMPLIALAGTSAAYALLHHAAVAFSRRPPNTSLERTRDR